MKFSSKITQFDPYELQTKPFTDLAHRIAKSREDCILDQLNDFISRGLIEVQVIGSEFVRAADSNNVEFREAVRLVLKDKEYIEKLEKENAELKEYKKQVMRILNEGK